MGLCFPGPASEIENALLPVRQGAFQLLNSVVSASGLVSFHDTCPVTCHNGWWGLRNYLLM